MPKDSQQFASLPLNNDSGYQDVPYDTNSWAPMPQSISVLRFDMQYLFLEIKQDISNKYKIKIQ
jgi:hypothetical protein